MLPRVISPSSASRNASIVGHGVERAGFVAGRADRRFTLPVRFLR